MTNIINDRLRTLADEDYKVFNSRIISTNYVMLGVRMPALRKLSKELSKEKDIRDFLDNPDFETYEHVILYGFILAQMKDLSLQQVFAYLDPLILRFDNWAHVDTLATEFKIFEKYPIEVYHHFLPLKEDKSEFTKRFFVILSMGYYLNSQDLKRTLKDLTEIQQGQYYVDMAIAWSLSVALVKFYDEALTFLENKVFTKFVHNKAIQKARESYRISSEKKNVLNKLKIK